jgi:ribose transport system substrate-binding protein
MARRLAALAVAGVMLVSACSSSNSDSGNGSTSPSSAASPSSGGSGGDSTLAQVQAIVAQLSQRPSAIGLEGKPLSHIPPTGKTLAMLDGLVVGSGYRDGLIAAAKALGWTVKDFQSGSTPEEQNAAMGQAVQQKVNAIFFPGGDTSILAPSLAQTKAAHIPVFFSNSNNVPTGLSGNGVVGAIVGPNDIRAYGKAEANWVYADSAGKVKTVLDVIVSNEQTTLVEDQQVKDTLKGLCPSCVVKDLPVQFTDIGKVIPNEVVADARQDPSITYVVFTFGALSTGTASALKAAGLSSKVKLLGIAPEPANLQALQNGGESMWVEYDQQLIGWRFTDMYARYLEDGNTSVEDSTLLPGQILTKNNLQPGDIQDYVANSTYPALFKKLWHVSGG